MSIITTDPPKTRYESKIDGPGANEYDGYFCIELDKVSRCRCGRTMRWVEVDEYHMVVVWEEKDDEELLKIASRIKQNGENPRIVEYKITFGEAHEFYDAVEKGLVEYYFDART